MKPVSLYRWCKLEGQSGWRLVTVEYNSLSTKMSLLDVVTCDRKAFYIHCGSFFFFHPRTRFLFFFNSSMTPFPFHLISSWEHLQKSSESTPWIDFSSGSGPSPTSKGFLFTSLRSKHNPFPPPLSLQHGVIHVLELAIWLICFIIVYGSV